MAMNCDGLEKNWRALKAERGTVTMRCVRAPMRCVLCGQVIVCTCDYLYYFFFSQFRIVTNRHNNVLTVLIRRRRRWSSTWKPTLLNFESSCTWDTQQTSLSSRSKFWVLFLFEFYCSEFVLSLVSLISGVSLIETGLYSWLSVFK